MPLIKDDKEILETLTSDGTGHENVEVLGAREGSHRWLLTPFMPRGSAVIWRASPPMPGPSSVTWNARM